MTELDKTISVIESWLKQPVLTPPPINELYDALELLKEQEPLEPYACEGDMKCGNGCEIVGYIRESDGKIERLANYCPYCGRPVKWE